MHFHWVPPPSGTLKINVHGTFSEMLRPSCNDSGLGAIYRDHNGDLKLVTVGTISYLTPLGNQLWAAFIALVRAYLEGYRDIILETDNYEAYLIMKNAGYGAPAEVYDLASQIDIRINDIRWKCEVVFCYPAMNKVARYLARVGMESCDRVYTFNRSIGGVEELLYWDMGFGVEHSDFQDVFLPEEAMDPVNFNVAISLTDQIKDLGLGQVGAAILVPLDMVVNADLLQEGDGIQEDHFRGGVLYHEGTVYTGDTPILQVD